MQFVPFGSVMYKMALNENLFVIVLSSNYLIFYMRNSTNHFNDFFNYKSANYVNSITINDAGTLVILG